MMNGMCKSMNFSEELRNFLLARGITSYAVMPFDRCAVWNASLLARNFPSEKDKPQSALLLLLPYYTEDHPERNVSLYAVPRDYHLFSKTLFAELQAFLESCFPGELFRGFADHSPIDERKAFSAAGLGVIGDNSLLITQEYGSYVFLAEVISTLPVASWEQTTAISTDKGCFHCGKCKDICPMESLSGCLSYLTQQKGDLSPETIAAMKRYHTVWGCDLCQTVCPMNSNIKPTPIPFFKEQLLPTVTAEMIDAMPPELFEERAFAWKKKKTILRNIAAVEETKEET